MPNLDQLKRVRLGVVAIRRFVYTRVWGMDIHPSAMFSLKAHFDRTFPAGVHVGAESYIAFRAVLLTHDLTRGVKRHTRVGSRCFIGAHSILLPGVTVGDGSIVATGAVVTRDVAPGTIVAGNPAVAIRTGIETGVYGQLRRNS